MITNPDVVFSSRLGGAVVRYHTWPTLQHQTVMDHTGNAIRIYWFLFGEVPAPVCAYMIFHDLPEVNVGDPPHPIKLHNPGLKSIYDDLEDATLIEMVGEERAQAILCDVTDAERIRMKVCDLLEMAEFAAIEHCLGNKFAPTIITKVRHALNNMELGDDDLARIGDYWDSHVEKFANA